MKKLMLAFSLIAIIGFTAFINPEENKADQFIGVYGVGGCGEDIDDNSTILLKLNEDMTYTYKDRSNRNNVIDISGNWRIDKNKVVLEGNEDVKFHDDWKLDDNGICIKSRRSLSYYRICKKS